MPHKKLKSLDSQRKITDFAFGKHGQAQPNAGLETQNHTVNDTVDNDDSAAEKAGEKRDFQPCWLQQHHWLRYDKSQNKMICKLCSNIGAKNALSLGTDRQTGPSNNADQEQHSDQIFTVYSCKVKLIS